MQSKYQIAKEVKQVVDRLLRDVNEEKDGLMLQLQCIKEENDGLTLRWPVYILNVEPLCCYLFVDHCLCGVSGGVRWRRACRSSRMNMPAWCSSSSASRRKGTV